MLNEISLEIDAFNNQRELFFEREEFYVFERDSIE